MTSFLLVVALVGTLTSLAFFLLVVTAVVRKQLVPKRFSRTSFEPPISVLKPVHGMEPQLDESLESFFQQDYPDYELIFCARHADDPALLLAERLSGKYPKVRVKILTSGEPPWTNAKVYSLARMMEAAENELIVISDSDVRVTRDYLREIVRPLEDEHVGLVTCVYRGVSVDGFWSKLEALGMSVEMTSGVLVAEMLEGMKFALGPTMVTRKRCVQAVGGFEAFADYCADDYLLGNLIDKQGYKVVLSEHAVDHIVVHRSLAESLKHQVRWMRSTRFSRPKGHVGTVLTFAMPFGVLGLIAGVLGHHLLLGVVIFAVTYLERVMQSVIAGYGVVGDRQALWQAWLYPVRDLQGFFVWCGSYFSSKIDWRAEVYRLTTGGRMIRASADPRIASFASSSPETPN